jgi:hypothetical protein
MHHLMWGLWIIAAACYVAIFRDIMLEVRGE